MSAKIILQFFTFFILVHQFYSQEISFCDDYLKCMEQLEIKQHECLELDRNVRLRLNDNCSRKKWDKKVELNALHMRRAEIARDCVRKNSQDIQIAESTLDDEMKKQCFSVHEKFRFTKNVTLSTIKSNRKKRSTKRLKREAKKSIKATECRNSARLWHKHCSSLSKCCPLVEDCKQSTKEIMEQIFEEREKLRQLHNNCL